MSNLRYIPFAEHIAKCIHVTYPSMSSMPEEFRNNLSETAKLNPDFTIEFYDDQAVVDVIKNEFGQEVLSLYLRINPKYGAARADLFRYLCIYRFGGVYLDVKAKLNKPLSQSILPSDRYILSHWDREVEGGRFATWGDQPGLENVPGGEFQQWHVIACAGHPFLRAVIEAVAERIRCYSPFRVGSGRNGVLRTTGPIVYTQTIHSLIEKHQFRLVNIVRDLGIEYSMFSGVGGERHRQLFKYHYGQLTEPVVLNKGLTDSVYNVSMNCIKWLRGIRNYIRSEKSSLSNPT